MKPVPVAGFIHFNKNLDTTLPKFYHYRKPKLVKSSKGWYIEYWYRVPVEVREFYLNSKGQPKEWERFRFREDINRRKGSEKLIYAEWLLKEITESLEKGYNPFSPEKELVELNNYEAPETSELDATSALNLFLEKWKDKGLEPLSYAKYVRYVNRLIDWLKVKRIPYIDIKLITQDHIEKFLSDTKKAYSLSNREYNNHFDFIRTAFNFLLKKKYISESPCAGVSKLKTKSTKHKFFDNQTLEKITAAMKAADPYVYLAFQTVYHLCVRSDKELMNLKVGNVKWDQDLLLAEVSKTDQRYIPMDSIIKDLLRQHIGSAPDDYFIFGVNGTPADKPFGRGFFAKRFRKVRDLAGLSSDYTIYGAKHTRVIHLKQDNASDADIMSLTGHKDFTAYAKYLRDLGLDANPEKLSKLSRKI